MSETAEQRRNDWLARTYTNVRAWWVPKIAIVAALSIAVPLRVSVWIIALLWMGMACLLNAWRCGRTHCRYTGPFYLAMILPVVVLGFDQGLASIYAWLALALLIVCGGWVIRWKTEQAWGRYWA